MQKFKLYAVLSVLFAGLLCLCQAANDNCYVDDYEDDDDAGKSKARNGNGLCADFGKLRDLIPSSSLLNIIASHYKYNRKFRRAMRYIDTAEFTSAVADLQQNYNYQCMLTTLREADVNLTDVESIKDLLTCIKLPAANTAASRATKIQKSTKTFYEDILSAFPKDKVFDFIEDSLLNVDNFSKFYKAERSTDFQNRLKKILASTTQSKAYKALKRQGIDLRKLLELIDTILSWGPTDY